MNSIPVALVMLVLIAVSLAVVVLLGRRARRRPVGPLLSTFVLANATDRQLAECRGRLAEELEYRQDRL